MAKTTEQEFNRIFPIIDPGELIGHKLLEHKPKNIRQNRLLGDINKGIYLKLPVFRKPCMDPSEEDGEIVFKPGNKPAIGHSPAWWRETWKYFMPSKNSRSGTELHWAAFLGKLMKYLVDEKNYSVEEAWEAVCNDSRDLGHYWNSKDAKHDFEPTGSRKVGLFCDFANTCKILENSETSGILNASGFCRDNSYNYPLASIMHSCNDFFSVGWLVLDV